ncbi:hypothetical protein C4556_00860 [Candidatus Parcubacteria bacterium]|nr:MAG: hypothetical protein C4556_00860 [Candidatus Parcubacteria bacterium]
MFVDHPPVPNCPARQVIVIEEKDKPYTILFVDQVVEKARMFDATSRDADNDEIFWIVYGNEPRRVWDMTESALRSSLRRPKSERLPKEQLLAMGDDAPLGEILESFEYGSNLDNFARREMPRVCRELEVNTLGQLRQHKRAEIRGPQCCRAGQRTLSYLDAVLREFGKPDLRYYENA